ncbi:hypothetical protein GUJ93_ZPchr0008g13387 [Zizania palustris]|uniref:Uncharacterized protein n=1 Tax=Zizania palustris TaxID=103762 RepID=A0A8J5R5Z0_ZIZPA|nr:hypothetical protein GUJ93_ZPchr0008g13387 [Zizania palustris]
MHAGRLHDTRAAAASSTGPAGRRSRAACTTRAHIAAREGVRARASQRGDRARSRARARAPCMRDLSPPRARTAVQPTGVHLSAVPPVAAHSCVRAWQRRVRARRAHARVGASAGGAQTYANVQASKSGCLRLCVHAWEEENQ